MSKSPSSGQRRHSKVRRSLLGRRQIGGVDYSLAVGNFTVFFGLAYMTAIWPLVGVAFVTHWLLRRAGKNDPSVLQAYARFVYQGTRYEPWPHAGRGKRVTDNRPEHFARGEAW
ncbi:MAG: VirB3 family type IV secretion system protein [Acidithiobacillus sp.]|nr:VirB3 family type IV secretion system protein [Acidithiobacillus sp.]